MSVQTKAHCLTSNPSLRRYEDIRELVGSPADPTPMVRLNKVVSPGSFELYVKLEWFNPFGSIKDRIALYMLKRMEEAGLLDGKEIVEPTSGNTGIGLAAVAALMGKKLTVTIQGVLRPLLPLGSRNPGISPSNKLPDLLPRAQSTLHCERQSTIRLGATCHSECALAHEESRPSTSRCFASLSMTCKDVSAPRSKSGLQEPSTGDTLPGDTSHVLAPGGTLA